MLDLHLCSALLAPLLIAFAAITPAAAQSPEETAIQQILTGQEKAWNTADSHAWAADFTEDADFINILGMVFHGKTEIDQRHAVIFAGPYQGSHVTITTRRLTLLSPTIALVETEHEVTHFRALPPGITPTSEGTLRTRMKYVMKKTREQWLIVAAQNTAERPM